MQKSCRNSVQKNVLISLGGDGAMLIDEFGKRHKAGVLKEKVINTVGFGRLNGSRLCGRI